MAITKQAYRFYLKDFVSTKDHTPDMLVASDAAESGDLMRAQTLARRSLPHTWELFMGLAKHGKRVD